MATVSDTSTVRTPPSDISSRESLLLRKRSDHGPESVVQSDEVTTTMEDQPIVEEEDEVDQEPFIESKKPFIPLVIKSILRKGEFKERLQKPTETTTSDVSLTSMRRVRFADHIMRKEDTMPELLTGTKSKHLESRMRKLKTLYESTIDTRTGLIRQRNDSEFERRNYSANRTQCLNSLDTINGLMDLVCDTLAGNELRDSFLRLTETLQTQVAALRNNCTVLNRLEIALAEEEHSLINNDTKLRRLEQRLLLSSNDPVLTVDQQSPGAFEQTVRGFSDENSDISLSTLSASSGMTNDLVHDYYDAVGDIKLAHENLHNLKVDYYKNLNDRKSQRDLGFEPRVADGVFFREYFNERQRQIRKLCESRNRAHYLQALCQQDKIPIEASEYLDVAWSQQFDALIRPDHWSSLEPRKITNVPKESDLDTFHPKIGGDLKIILWIDEVLRAESPIEDDGFLNSTEKKAANTFRPPIDSSAEEVLQDLANNGELFDIDQPEKRLKQEQTLEPEQRLEPEQKLESDQEVFKSGTDSPQLTPPSSHSDIDDTIKFSLQHSTMEIIEESSVSEVYDDDDADDDDDTDSIHDLERIESQDSNFQEETVPIVSESIRFDQNHQDEEDEILNDISTPLQSSAEFAIQSPRLEQKNDTFEESGFINRGPPPVIDPEELNKSFEGPKFIHRSPPPIYDYENGMNPHSSEELEFIPRGPPPVIDPIELNDDSFKASKFRNGNLSSTREIDSDESDLSFHSPSPKSDHHELNNVSSLPQKSESFHNHDSSIVFEKNGLDTFKTMNLDHQLPLTHLDHEESQPNSNPGPPPLLGHDYESLSEHESEPSRPPPEFDPPIGNLASSILLEDKQPNMVSTTLDETHTFDIMSKSEEMNQKVIVENEPSSLISSPLDDDEESLDLKHMEKEQDHHQSPQNLHLSSLNKHEEPLELQLMKGESVYPPPRHHPPLSLDIEEKFLDMPHMVKEPNRPPPPPISGKAKAVYSSDPPPPPPLHPNLTENPTPLAPHLPPPPGQNITSPSGQNVPPPLAEDIVLPPIHNTPAVPAQNIPSTPTENIPSTTTQNMPSTPAQNMPSTLAQNTPPPPPLQLQNLPPPAGNRSSRRDNQSGTTKKIPFNEHSGPPSQSSHSSFQSMGTSTVFEQFPPEKVNYRERSMVRRYSNPAFKLDDEVQKLVIKFQGRARSNSQPPLEDKNFTMSNFLRNSRILPRFPEYMGNATEFINFFDHSKN